MFCSLSKDKAKKYYAARSGQLSLSGSRPCDLLFVRQDFGVVASTSHTAAGKVPIPDRFYHQNF